MDLDDLEQSIIDMLHTCYDPEIPVDIYELGLIYGVTATEDGDVTIQMTLTAPACPVAESLPVEVEEKLRRIPGVRSARVELVWEPQWDRSMMSEGARLDLGML